MLNIVFALRSDQTKVFFLEKHLKRIRELGELTINQSTTRTTADELKEMVKCADFVVTSWGSPQIDEIILNNSPRLKAVFHAGGTVKGIISPGFIERGIRVTNAVMPLGKGVAETALGMTIASLKNMWTLSGNIKMGEWKKGFEDIRELYEIKIGVIGAGNAGGHYIKLLKNFDVEILLYDPIIDSEKAREMGVTKMELDDLLKAADVVSIHAPSIPATKKMINKERLQMMKDNAILINTARGAIIDEAALIDELSGGRLFACLDVTDPEPPAEDNPLRSMPNVIMTPHIAGLTNNGLLKIGGFLTEEMERFVEGKKMVGEVDFSKLDVLA